MNVLMVTAGFYHDLNHVFYRFGVFLYAGNVKDMTSMNQLTDKQRVQRFEYSLPI